MFKKKHRDLDLRPSMVSVYPFCRATILDESDGTIPLPVIPRDTYLADDRYLEELVEMWLIQSRTGG